MGRTLIVTLLLGIAGMLAGCTFSYTPKQDIAAAPYVNSVKPGGHEPLRLVDVTDPDAVITSRTCFYTYNATLSDFGDAVAASLERELVKNGFQITKEASQAIRIDVVDVEMAYPKKYRCDINLVVGIGERNIGIATDSPAGMNYADAIDDAIADAVRRILSHQEVAAYLNSIK